MTDKQIIIDGVDVSGCCQYMPRYMEDYDIDTLDYCGYHFKPCKDVDVKYCYYKQLKRAENQIVELNKTIQAKEQECETQQKALELQKSFLDHSDCKLKQAKQKLEKIKDYCKEQNLKADWTACEILKIIEE